MKLAPVISLAGYRMRKRLVPIAGELRRQHVHLEIVCEALVAVHHDGMWENVLEEWRYFEPSLLEHMAREEQDFFPAFRETHPDEVAALIAQHAELRKLLEIVGVGTELHSISMADVEQLVTTLREHAEREELAFYPWLDELTAEHATTVNGPSVRCPVR